MRRLFAEGSFSTAFVPVFTEVKETRPFDDLKELVARVAGTLGGMLLVLTALGLIFAPQIAAVFAPARSTIRRKFALTVELLRLTFPFILFVSLTALSRRRAQQLPPVRAAGVHAGDPQPLHDRRRAVAGAAPGGADPGAGLGGPGGRHRAAGVPVAGAGASSTC